MNLIQNPVTDTSIENYIKTSNLDAKKEQHSFVNVFQDVMIPVIKKMQIPTSNAGLVLELNEGSPAWLQVAQQDDTQVIIFSPIEGGKMDDEQFVVFVSSNWNNIQLVSDLPEPDNYPGDDVIRPLLQQGANALKTSAFQAIV